MYLSTVLSYFTPLPSVDISPPHTRICSMLSGVSEKDFLTYNGTFRDDFTGTADTEVGPGSAKVEGQVSFKLQSCFGTLKKEELNMKKLLRDSSSRC